ncbi:MAG: peptidoglycan DD-metalloendopeptidase family protein [Firmicutes bacterium]|nr:peptidoglycan DD-metalloendopeptidase family protein [Bacillota bacterium]
MIEETRSALQQTKKREQKAVSILTKNQRELNKIQQNLNTINGQLKLARARAAQTQEELRQTEAQLRALEEEMEARRDLLRKRIDVFYRYGPLTYLDVLLGATSLGDLVYRYELAGYFVRQDLKLIEDYRQMYRQVMAKRRELQARHEELKERTQAIAVLQARAAMEQRKAAEKVRQTQQEVAKIQADRVRLEQALEELERLSRELGSEIRRRGSGASLGTGRMMWPVSGRVTSGFGWRRHPVLKTNKFHTGIDIAVPTGTPVYAADTGVVLIAGWRGGYGYLVAIDHGRGLSTFYAHNSTLLVKEGDVVVKGQRIALSGNTGLSTGPHLHFEVRVNGDPVNPMPYLP